MVIWGSPHITPIFIYGGFKLMPVLKSIKVNDIVFDLP
jgi:hypothetical protein